MKIYSKLFSVLVVMMLGLFLVSCENKNAQVDELKQEEATSPSQKIVFIDIDSLLSNYDLYKDRRAELEAQSEAAESSLGSKIEAFQKRVAKLQQDFAKAQQNAANIAPVELKKMEDDFIRQQNNLAKEEEALMKQRDNAAMDLDSKLQKLQMDLQEKIDQYLEKVAESEGYDLVLMRGSGGSVMYGRNSLDITDVTLKTLNKEYSDSKDKTKTGE